MYVVHFCTIIFVQGYRYTNNCYLLNSWAQVLHTVSSIFVQSVFKILHGHNRH